MLGDAGLRKEIIAYIVKSASVGPIRSKDAIKTTIIQSEIKVDQMRIKALTSDSSLRRSTPHKLFLSDTRETGFVMI